MQSTLTRERAADNVFSYACMLAVILIIFCALSQPCVVFDGERLGIQAYLRLPVIHNRNSRISVSARACVHW
jgi:hypothetical protein